MNRIISQDDEIKGYENRFFRKYKIAEKMRRSNFSKEKGFSYVYLFRLVFMLVFTGRSLMRFLQAGVLDRKISKDSIYRFLNSPRNNWKRLLLGLAAGVIKEWLLMLTSKERVKVLIVDDSLFSRNRSKTVELLARVYDHVEHKYRKGFRMLTLGWSDGTTFIPLIFSLLSSAKEQNRICDINPEIDKRTNGYKRRLQSTKRATEVLFELLDEVRSYSIPAQYLLFDSWFANPRVIIRAHQKKMHTICMLKDTPKIFYTYKGKKRTLGGLYKEINKRRGKAKILASIEVVIGKDIDGQGVDAKIVFVRERNRGRRWLAILSTDINLEEQEIVRIYGKRWDIEVFFKMAKSHLKLAKEFQGRSYDAMIAHTTIVCLRYIMLALEKRESEDNRTIGGIFYYLCEEVQDIRFIDALMLLIEILKENLARYSELPKKIFEKLISNFIAALPLAIKGRLRFSFCES